MTLDTYYRVFEKTRIVKIFDEYYCSICKTTIKDPLEHFKQIHYCEECDVVFAKKSGKKVHLRIKHANKELL